MKYGLEVTLEEVDRKMVLRLDGRIDTASSSILEKKIDGLIEDNHHQILLDFANVDYLSSAGMRLLLSTTKKLKAKGGILVIFSIDEEVKKVIQMAGFEGILQLCKNESEAIQKSE